jgi:glycosyltransferase involved in cell wall biosynthesis
MRIGIDAREMGAKPTGVGRYLSNILYYWIKEFSHHRYYLYFKDEPEDNELLHFPHVSKRLIPSNTLSFNMYWQQIQLPPQIKKDNIDIFFSPSYSIPLRCNVKRAVTIHDISFEAHPEWFRPKERFSRRFFTKKSARAADIIFTVSQFSKSEIIKYYGIPENKIAVVPNGVDNHFQPVKDKKSLEEFQKKHNITGRTILYAGSIFNRRRLPILMEAFKKVCQEHEDVQLLIAGENRTYPYQNLPALAHKLGINNRTHFFNFVDENTLLLLYNIADIFVYLSEYEGFGIPLLEALACGTPAISSDNSALQEIFSLAAVLIPINEVEELYRAIMRLLNNLRLGSELVENGKKLWQKYSYEETARETMHYLENLMD